MTVLDLKNILNDFPEYWEVQVDNKDISLAYYAVHQYPTDREILALSTFESKSK